MQANARTALASTSVLSVNKSNLFLMKLPLTISKRQEKNPMIPLLGGIDTRFTQSDIFDFAITDEIAILFLTIKFHRLNPQYFDDRAKKLIGPWKTRILILLIDDDNPNRHISALTQTAMAHNMTTVLAFGYEEASKWLHSYYTIQDSSLDELKSTSESNYDIAVNMLHSLNISRKDAEDLLNTFGSIDKILKASKEQISKATSMSSSKIDAFFAAIDKDF